MVMVWERLGVLTDEVSPRLMEALDWIQQEGLRHVEIRMIDGVNVMSLTNEQVEHVRKEVERRGLFVSAIASPVFKCVLDPLRKVASGDTFGQMEEDVCAHFSKLLRAMEIAQGLGTNRIRIFSFWREQDPQQVESEIVMHLQEAASLAEKKNMLLLLENEPACNGGYANEVGNLVRRVGSKALKVLWDPGNEEYGGRPAFPEGYDEVKDVLGHVHLKDAFISQEGKSYCVPIGSGRVPYTKQLEALERDGYSGLFTIETHYVPEGGTTMDGTRMTLEALRALLKEVEL